MGVIRNSRKMITAVNRELRTMPQHVQDSALAELAREVARDFDAGERAAAGRLARLLDGLRKLAEPPPAARKAAAAAGSAAEGPNTEDGPDELDDLARARADRLAAAQGVVRAIGPDQRRTGGRPAG